MAEKRGGKGVPLRLWTGLTPWETNRNRYYDRFHMLIAEDNSHISYHTEYDMRWSLSLSVTCESQRDET